MSGRRTGALGVGLGAALACAFFLALALGPSRVALGDVGRALLTLIGVDSPSLAESARLVVTTVRLPRALLALGVGATLATAGAAIQGLYRNPLAEPGLVGVSAGGSLGAALAIVVGAPVFAASPAWLRPTLLPFAAFAGSLGVTELVLRVGTVGGRASALVMILAGVAVNAFVGALIGGAAYWASDRQLRDLVFWMLGSLASSNERTLFTTLPPMVIGTGLLLAFGRTLDLLSLGDADARRLGVRVDRDKRRVVVLVALGVGASVAAAGLIGFVGLVVPHLVRLARGPGHRALLPLSALLGATLVLACDTLARTVVAPLELPLGVLTALAGAPVFLALLLRARRALA